MVSIDKAVVARYKQGNKIFEILVDCEKAIEFRSGKSISLDEVLATNEIFKDAKKAERVSDSDLKSVFKTEDINEAAKIIIQKGEIHLTKDYQDKLREEKRRKIINFIHRNAVDAKTGLPHPPQRIENAMNEAKVRIDDNKSADEQVEDIIKQLRIILPIKFEIREIEIKIPPQFAGGSYNIFKKFGKLIKDEWEDDGSLKAVVEIPAGITEELFNELNKLTHGEVESKIIKTK